MLVRLTPRLLRASGLVNFYHPFREGEGGAGTGTGAGGEGTGGNNPPPPPPPQGGSKTFTQDELDRIVSDRLARERDKFKDYKDLQEKAKSWDELQESQKSQLDKEREAREKTERESAERIAAADKRLIAAEIKSLVAGRVHNPDVVVSLLANSPKIKVNGDTVEGAKDAVEELLNANPYLKKTASGKSGGDFNGSDNKTLDEQIAAAEQAGNWKESNRLKLMKLRG